MSQLAAALQRARAVAAQGDLRAARDMLTEAVEVGVGTVGADHPDVLVATRQLARIHGELGELPDARRLLDDALAAGHFRLGEGHPVMLGMAYDLAVLADELGNLYEARRRYGQVARLGPEAFGDDHEYVLAAREYLGDRAPEPATSAHRPLSADPGGVASPWRHDPTRVGDESGEDGDGEDDEGKGDPAGRPDPRTYVPGQPRPGERAVVDEPPRQRTAAPVTTLRAAPTTAPEVWDAEPPRRRPVKAILIVVAIALLGGALAATITFLSMDGTPEVTPTEGAPGTATAGGSGAPTGLTMRDDSTSITLTWKDPSNGTVSFIVAGGQDGAGVRPLHTLLPGTTTHTVSGLNPRLEYCFTIAAVYDTNRVAVSDLVCTRRGVSPRPSR